MTSPSTRTPTPVKNIIEVKRAIVTALETVMSDKPAHRAHPLTEGPKRVDEILTGATEAQIRCLPATWS